MRHPEYRTRFLPTEFETITADIAQRTLAITRRRIREFREYRT